MPPASRCSSGTSLEGTCACKSSSSPSFGWGLALGLLGGAIGGIALARRTALAGGTTAAFEPAGLRIWRRELAKTRGAVAAGFLCARVQHHFDELYAARPRFDHPALRNHLEKNILPGLALYRALCEKNADAQGVFAELDRLFEASMVSSTVAVQARLLGLFPDPFSVFRAIITRTLPQQYPTEEWAFRWVENSPDVVAFDATDCFYLRVLTEYDTPELTAHFCRLDDVMMSHFPYFAWKRTRTIGRGDAVCDFRYERMK